MSVEPRRAGGAIHGWAVPSHDRDKYPARWVRGFGWRQVTLWTPKVALRSAIVTLRIWPRNGGLLLGLYVGRDDDGEWIVRLGVGVIEVEVNVMEWSW